MDNFEDNCVENNQKVIKQQPESQSDEWFQIWSNYLSHSPFKIGEKNEQSHCVMQKVLEATLQGDSCIETSSEDIQQLEDLALAEHLVSKTQIAPFIYDEQYLYLYRYWALENSLAKQVGHLKKQDIPPISLQGIDDLLSDPYQKKAVEIVAKNSLSMITGGPGTGKTYTLARIIAILNQAYPNIRIALAAPTGKAAQRMKEALQNSFNDEKLETFLSPELKNITPITIHRLLGLGNQHQPKFNAKQPLPYDLIIIDEASMLDLNLANMLFLAIPDQARLILLGDAQQLASVDVGNVLADLQDIKALAENRVNLVTSRRFKDGALIGEMAKFIQAQTAQDYANVLEKFESAIVPATTLQAIALSTDMPDTIQLEYLPEETPYGTTWDVYYDQLFYGFDSYVQAIQHYINQDNLDVSVDHVVKRFDDYRILTAIRHSALGLSMLNLQMEQRFLAKSNQIKQGDWYVGRPVMMTYNDYQLGLSNGDIGICLKRHDFNNAPFEVYFPSLEKWILATRLPKNIETAYVLTIHKSQGSEFKHTAVVLDEMATKLLSKELIYTAITRAKSVVSLLVNKTAFRTALTTKTLRKSGLLSKINILF